MDLEEICSALGYQVPPKLRLPNLQLKSIMALGMILWDSVSQQDLLTPVPQLSLQPKQASTSALGHRNPSQFKRPNLKTTTSA